MPFILNGYCCRITGRILIGFGIIVKSRVPIQLYVKFYTFFFPAGS